MKAGTVHVPIRAQGIQRMQRGLRNADVAIRMFGYQMPSSRHLYGGHWSRRPGMDRPSARIRAAYEVYSTALQRLERRAHQAPTLQQRFDTAMGRTSTL